MKKYAVLMCLTLFFSACQTMIGETSSNQESISVVKKIEGTDESSLDFSRVITIGDFSFILDFSRVITIGDFSFIPIGLLQIPSLQIPVNDPKLVLRILDGFKKLHPEWDILDFEIEKQQSSGIRYYRLSGIWVHHQPKQER